MINIRCKPNIIVLGNNPGHDGMYDPNFSIEEFLVGNMKWAQHREWIYNKRVEYFLEKWLGKNAESIFSNDNKLIYINASCLATKKSGALNKNILRQSLPYTIELIKILRPNLVLCLSAKKIFNLTNSFEREYITDDIILGQLDNIPIIGVPHPSSRMTNAKRQYIRDVIDCTMTNIDLKLSERANLLKDTIKELPQKICKFSAYEILEKILRILSKSIGVQWLNLKTAQLKLNSDIAIIITSTQNGYVGIRHILYDKKYNEKEYPNTQKYVSELAYFGFEIMPTNGCWIGTKSFKKYGYDEELIVDEIVKEIKNIREIVSN